MMHFKARLRLLYRKTELSDHITKNKKLHTYIHCECKLRQSFWKTREAKVLVILFRHSDVTTNNVR